MFGFAWVVLVMAGVFAVHALGAGPAGTAAPESCSSISKGAIRESQDFIPFEMTYGLPESPISPGGGPGGIVEPDGWIPTVSLDGLPLQYAWVGEGDLSLFFFDEPLDRSMTLAGLLAEGGVTFNRYPLEPGFTADHVLEVLGDRAVALDIGPYAGVLTWDDPMANGVRPHQIWWSDGTYAYSLFADRSAAAAANLARGMVCGSV